MKRRVFPPTLPVAVRLLFPLCVCLVRPLDRRVQTHHGRGQGEDKPSTVIDTRGRGNKTEGGRPPRQKPPKPPGKTTPRWQPQQRPAAIYQSGGQERRRKKGRKSRWRKGRGDSFFTFASPAYGKHLAVGGAAFKVTGVVWKVIGRRPARGSSNLPLLLLQLQHLQWQ